MNDVTSEELRSEFWQTLKALKNRKIDAATANAMTAAGRGILSTVKLELQMAEFTNKKPTKKLLDFTQG